jgi:hypothetical protein
MSYPYRARECLACGRWIELTRNATYRRHFSPGLNGRLHLCPTSKRNALTPAELAKRA